MRNTSDARGLMLTSEMCAVKLDVEEHVDGDRVASMPGPAEAGRKSKDLVRTIRREDPASEPHDFNEHG